jgi:hypothetical protein
MVSEFVAQKLGWVRVGSMKPLLYTAGDNRELDQSNPRDFEFSSNENWEFFNLPAGVNERAVMKYYRPLAQYYRPLKRRSSQFHTGSTTGEVFFFL